MFVIQFILNAGCAVLDGLAQRSGVTEMVARDIAQEAMATNDPGGLRYIPVTPASPLE